MLRNSLSPCVILALAAVGCGQQSSGTPVAAAGSGPAATSPSVTVPEDRDVAIYTWWTDSGEEQALAQLEIVHQQRYPADDLEPYGSDTSLMTQQSLRVAMISDNPPELFQANIGADLMYWTRPTEALTPIESLSDLAEEEGWFEVMHEKSRDLASYEGDLDRLYGVPLNVHRLNALFYSKHVFNTLGIEIPDQPTLPWLNETMREIKSQGVAPLGLGLAEDWILPHLVFEIVMPAIAGGDFYERFWRGEILESEWVYVAQALDWVLAALCGESISECDDGYANSDAATANWIDAVGYLVEDRVAMVPMGDWARGYLLMQEQQAGVDFDAMVFPFDEGVDPVCVFTSDTLAMTKGGSSEVARDFLRTAGSVEGQVAFNAFKGSVPARNDIDDTDITQYRRSLGVTPEVDSLYGETIRTCFDHPVLARSGVVHPRVMEDLGLELKSSLVENHTIEIALAYIRASYLSLRRSHRD